MRKTLLAAVTAVTLSCSSAVAHVAIGTVAQLGICGAGAPVIDGVSDGATLTDCETGGGNHTVACLCSNGQRTALPWPVHARVEDLPLCEDGAPLLVYATDGASATDCATGGGTTEVACSCQDGAWAAIGGGSAALVIEEDNATVDGAATNLDFTEPDAVVVTSSPAGEANVALGGYGLLAGRSGGQTLYGGTTAGEHFSACANNDEDLPCVRLFDATLGGPGGGAQFRPYGLASATGSTEIGVSSICFEGTDDAYETCIVPTDPASADKTLTIPNADTVTVQGATCADGEVANGIDPATGEVLCTLDAGTAGSFGELAPYSNYDPDNPPAECFNSGFCDEFTPNAEQIAWEEGNIETATITYVRDAAIFDGDSGDDDLNVQWLTPPASGNTDFVIHAKIWTDPNTNNTTTYGCGLAILYGGTVATPTNIELFYWLNSTTDSWFVQTVTSYALAGPSTVDSIANDQLDNQYTPHYASIRYVDSTRVTTPALGIGTEHEDNTLTGATLSADPIRVGWFVRNGMNCTFEYVRILTGTDRNYAGERGSGGPGIGVIGNHGATATNTTTQAIADSTATRLTWDTTATETDDYHNPGSNPGRLTVPTQLGGQYLASCAAEFASNATGTRELLVYKNGAEVSADDVPPSGSDPTGVSKVYVDLAAAVGDYYECFVYQSSGASLNVTAAGSRFSLLMVNADEADIKRDAATDRAYYDQDSDGVMDASEPKVGGVYVLDSMTTPVDIDNSAAETTLYSFSVPGGTLAAEGRLVLELDCDFLNSTGANRFWTTRVKFGGSTLTDYQTPSNATSASRRQRYIRVDIQNLNSTSLQSVDTLLTFVGADGGGTLTAGDISYYSAEPSMSLVRETAATVDTTIDRTLEVTLQLSIANASLEWHCYSGTLTVMNP